MKKICITAAALFSFVIFTFGYQEKTLVGKWEGKSPNGTILGAVFKADHTYAGYANKEVFVTGKYEFKDNLLAMDDDQGCETKGTYKITFFADSILFSVVADGCTGRKKGTDKLVLGFVKSK
ncbi:MAG: hypothetical protein EOP42_14970 [Sphingobacteriaceae bacterium]|nr:MAG: hypothetical protein EOP42_14970 [Sphingobacteriaceae bacterium]